MQNFHKIRSALHAAILAVDECESKNNRGHAYQTAHDDATQLLRIAANELGLAVTAGQLQPALDTLAGFGACVDSMEGIITGRAEKKRERFLAALKL